MSYVVGVRRKTVPAGSSFVYPATTHRLCSQVDRENERYLAFSADTFALLSRYEGPPETDLIGSVDQGPRGGRFRRAAVRDRRRCGIFTACWCRARGRTTLGPPGGHQYCR